MMTEMRYDKVIKTYTWCPPCWFLVTNTAVTVAAAEAGSQWETLIAQEPDRVPFIPLLSKERESVKENQPQNLFRSEK